MEAALGAASGLVSSVVKQLSDELVVAYVASAELGLNAVNIKRDLMFTQGLLHEARCRGVADNPGLEGLLQQLTSRADEAEDALDELHYYIIQDQLDGTRYAVPDLGDGLCGHARHGLHALRHTASNCLACFSCSPRTMQDHDEAAAAAAVVAKLIPFDRVAMSKKIGRSKARFTSVHLRLAACNVYTYCESFQILHLDATSQASRMCVINEQARKIEMKIDAHIYK